MSSGHYDEYLDEHITATDRFYLDSVELARTLVEIGSRKADILSRQEYLQRQKEQELNSKKQLNANNHLMISDASVKYESVVLTEIAKREADLRAGRLATLVYLCAKNAVNQEISGFVDLGERLKTDGAHWFSGSRKFLPAPRDLSLHNFDLRKTQTSTESENFQVVTSDLGGMQFRVKADRKLIDVQACAAGPGDGTVRSEIDTRGEYLHCVFFDHSSKRRIA